ncbi:MAG: beta-ketoacyl-ACP synthase II, partial [Pseudomonadota bacterium]|nr:beta-ketoacyl-ACP synthase II [Pseudomonadota bacterium]
MKRVVVTGFGTVCPLGADVETAWRRLIAGENGISRITRFDVGDIASKVGGQVLIGDEPGAFDPKSVMNPKELRKNDMFIVFAIAAADQAIRMSGWAADNDEAAERTGVLIGSGIGGLPMIVKSYHVLSEKGPRRLSPFFIPSCLINLASGQVSIRHGFKGPNHSIVTACSTGSHAIGDAARLIILGDADVMVAGGAESQICSLGLAGFSASRALSTSFNDTPEKASRPFDKDRDGFVAAEGAGIVVLEEYEHAKRRGAPILAELVGYGLSGDAYHITAPSPDGGGAYRAMKAALARA